MNLTISFLLLLGSLLFPFKAVALEQFSYEEGYENCVDYYIRVKFNNSYEAKVSAGNKSASPCPMQVI